MVWHCVVAPKIAPNSLEHTKNHVWCSVREPARYATKSSWPSRIFFPSRSLVASNAFLASWWHGLWISEVGRTLTALVGSLGITLKSVHDTCFGRSPCDRGHHTSQRVCCLAAPWLGPPAERLAEPSHRRRAAVPDRLVVLRPCPAPLANLVSVAARRARQSRCCSVLCACGNRPWCCSPAST